MARPAAAGAAAPARGCIAVARARRQPRSRRAAAARRSAGPCAPAGRGALVIVGGREDKFEERVILREIARVSAGGPLVVVSAASAFPDEVWEEYRVAFAAVGVDELVHLPVASRASALAGPGLEQHLAALARATGVFFTGGDQLKLTTKLGGTPLLAAIRDVFARGGAISGTSAGAAAMSSTMIVHGGDTRSHRLSEALHMAPGLGFVDGLIIDQHFAQRGRVARLLAAVAQNPSVIGVGIDEDTGILLEGARDRFRVIGTGACSVLDGQGISWSNVTEREDRTLSVFDVRLHVLNAGDVFDTVTHRPSDPDQVRAQLDAR